MDEGRVRRTPPARGSRATGEQPRPALASLRAADASRCAGTSLPAFKLQALPKLSRAASPARRPRTPHSRLTPPPRITARPVAQNTLRASPAGCAAAAQRTARRGPDMATPPPYAVRLARRGGTVYTAGRAGLSHQPTASILTAAAVTTKHAHDVVVALHGRAGACAKNMPPR